MLEILPALGYLHQLGLLFCDFKIDNVIQTQHSLKLIDLGGVYRMDDPTSAVFGTVGYQAPEIAAAGPSIASDLFTVARTLAVLCFDFRGYQSTYRFTLPAAGVGAAARALRLAVPLPPGGHRPQSRRSLPVGRGDGRPALRRAPRDRGRPGGTRGPGAEQAVQRPAARRPRAARLADPPPASGRHRRSRRRIPGHDQRRRSPAADRPAERGARADGRGRAAPRRRADRARRLGGGGGGAGRSRGGRSVGVARRSGIAAWPSSPASGRTWPARSSRPSTSRCPASSRPSSRSGSPASPPGK